jgi:hypothetical protein
MKTKGLALISIIVAATAVSSAILALFVLNNNSIINNQNNTEENSEPKYLPISGPPPIPITIWGPEASSFDEAKRLTGLHDLELPKYIPSNLYLESVRTHKFSINDTNVISITAIYVPIGYNTSNETLITDVLDKGLFIIYEVDDINSYKPDLKTWIEEFVAKAPDIRRIEYINGNIAVVHKGNQSIYIDSGVMMWKDDTNIRITIRSLKYDDLELKKIVESIP